MISVIVTTYNRAPQLKRGLFTLLNQSVLPDEIVVIDDGSQDNTRDVVESFNNPIIKYTYIDFPAPRISCIPRNIGIKKAKGDILIFTEPEALQVGDTIRELLHEMEKHPDNTILASQVWSMGPKIAHELTPDEYENPEKILRHPYACLVSSNMQNIKAPDADWAITGEAHCNAGVLFATRKKWLEEIGGFDESFEGHGYDDFDLFNRLGLYGKGILKCPGIKVIHQYHNKSFYPYDIYKAAEHNGKVSEANIHAGKFRVNEGKEWGTL